VFIFADDHAQLIKDIDRKCPGQFMASHILFAIICSVLSAFDITPPLDESGNPIKLQLAMSTGVLS
jgi:hypothetical protein